MKALAISILALIAVLGLALLTWPAQTIAVLVAVVRDAIHLVLGAGLLAWIIWACWVAYARRNL